MNDPDLMSDGLTLLFLGMGTVFVFLTLLVLVTSGMSVLVQKYMPEAAVISATKSRTVPPGGALPDQKLLAIISAAIHQHRTTRK